MYFEIYQEGNSLLAIGRGQWRWRLRSSNGRIIASGEAFHKESDCRDSIQLVMNTDAATPIHRVQP